MTNEVLTEEEATKLFNDIAGVIKDDDSNKLSELVKPADKEEADTTQADDKSGVQEPQQLEEGKDSPQVSAEEEADDKDEKDKNSTVESDELKKLQEQLAAVQRENHNLRSQAGRVPHVQRRLQELDKKLEELTKQQSTSPSSRPSTKIAPKVQEILKGISDTDPELAKAVAEAISAASDEVAGATHVDRLEQTKAEREAAYKDFQQEQTAILLEAYPNAPDVFKSSSWNEWMVKQSRAVQQLANSDTAEDVMFAFEKYAEDLKKQYPELAGEGDTKVGTTSTDDAEKARQIEAERARKKTNAPVVGSPSANGKVSVPDDPQALFNKFSEEIRKSRHG